MEVEIDDFLPVEFQHSSNWFELGFILGMKPSELKEMYTDGGLNIPRLQAMVRKLKRGLRLHESDIQRFSTFVPAAIGYSPSVN